MKNFFWSDGNSKMIKTSKAWKGRFGTYAKFSSFNIPRFKSKDGKKTCPYAGMCAEICYAGQGRMMMEKSMNVREKNLAGITDITMPQFRNKIVEDLTSTTTTHVRIHDSGDFFSRAYYNAWLEISEALPEMTFYSYTKSIPLIDWNAHPKNFRLVQSIGGTRDDDINYSRPHCKIFASEQERKKSKYCDGNISDIPAVMGHRRIGLVYHGTRNLTDDNLIQLRAI